MEKKNSTRTRIIELRLTQKEYEQIEEKCKNSTANKLSEFVRRIIFDKPVTMY